MWPKGIQIHKFKPKYEPKDNKSKSNVNIQINSNNNLLANNEINAVNLTNESDKNSISMPTTNSITN